MSCLSKEHRLNDSKDFNQLYKGGKKWHTHTFVTFFKADDEFKLAFVASKKVGNAVKRSQAKRKLRALTLKYEKSLKSGKYIFVAKEMIFQRTPKQLENDFRYAMKKLQLLNR